MDIDSHTFKMRVKLLITKRPFWSLFKLYKKFISKLHLHQYLLNKQLMEFAEKDLEKTTFNDLVVMSGPFKGLKYPEFKAFGSALFSKLAGTYEHALHRLFESENFQTYNRLIDIGCAEGYYAIGSGMINKHLFVMAIDPNRQALDFCRSMAVLNQISERMIYKEKFDTNSVEEFIQGNENSTLIICDCEGCEIEIFSENVINTILSKCDLIIELHDFINRETKQTLLNRFSNTHTSQIFREARMAVPFQHLKHLSSLQREIILDERRPEIMEWMLLQKK